MAGVLEEEVGNLVDESSESKNEVRETTGAVEENTESAEQVEKTQTDESGSVCSRL